MKSGAGKSDNRRELPSVEKVLREAAIEELSGKFGLELVTFAVRRSIESLRGTRGKTAEDPFQTVIRETVRTVDSLVASSLKPVINATGVVLHTNLGRAPMGEALLNEIAPLITGYCNLELDLSTGQRGHRADHITGLLTYLTGAPDAVVVNNNAAAIILVLNTFARDREVIISRGELIEIGGAFRIPEIMESGGARMVEVGTTNRTRLSDYEDAITPQTALIFKAHKSNYTISGFTEEATVGQLARMARAHNLPVVYDIGSGLLRKPRKLDLTNEPDVRGALKEGADLVTFSADKLLGGPQAGIVVGKKSMVSILAKAPLMRALRVGKLTLAALASACRHYLSDERLVETNPLFTILDRDEQALREMAKMLCDALKSNGVDAEVVPSLGQTGGGTLPDMKLPSFAVSIQAPGQSANERAQFAEKLFLLLLDCKRPVLAVLREGHLLFDVLTVSHDDIEDIALATGRCIAKINNTGS